MKLYAKANEVGEGRSTVATPEQLKLINKFTRRVAPYSAEEVYVGYVDLANDMVDRTYERFPVAILRQFARTAPGCSMLIGHDYSTAPVGLFFDAEVVKVGDVNWLRCWYYTPKTPDTLGTRDMIDSGVYRYASIGFGGADNGGNLQLICDICGNPINSAECPHWPGEIIDDKNEPARAVFHYEGEARMVEGSIVYLGAQYDAEMKGFSASEAAQKLTGDQIAFDIAASHAAHFTKSFEGILIPRKKQEAVDTEAPAEREEIEAEGEEVEEIIVTLEGDSAAAEESPAEKPIEDETASPEAEKVFKALDEIRAKVGRVISARNEEKLRDAVGKIEAAVEALSGVLSVLEGQGEEAAAEETEEGKDLPQIDYKKIGDLAEHLVEENLKSFRQQFAAIVNGTPVK